MKMNLDKLISLAYDEDIPKGDITTESLDVKEKHGKARLVAKEDLVLSGKDLFTKCLRHLNSEFKIKWYFSDGDFILNQQSVALIEGNLIDLLKAERVALNFLGKLSGISSLTRCFVTEISNTKCKILDTRKTTPLFRDLEKKAVIDGGGVNHRRDLSSAILIKENHITIAGSVEAALSKAQKHPETMIEIEVQNLEELHRAKNLKPDRIMLDNMTTEDMAEARKLTPLSIQLEASGNMSLKRVKEVAETGVNFISVGALTHSAPCADLSLLFEWA